MPPWTYINTCTCRYHNDLFRRGCVGCRYRLHIRPSLPLAAERSAILTSNGFEGTDSGYGPEIPWPRCGNPGAIREGDVDRQKLRAVSNSLWAYPA
jgi:hypothetical protein